MTQSARFADGICPVGRKDLKETLKISPSGVAFDTSNGGQLGLAKVLKVIVILSNVY
jgi:hypothetical protein